MTGRLSRQWSKTAIKTSLFKTDFIREKEMLHDRQRGDLELVCGSGNVFRDLGHPDPEAMHLKAIVAAKIIGSWATRN